MSGGFPDDVNFIFLLNNFIFFGGTLCSDGIVIEMHEGSDDSTSTQSWPVHLLAGSMAGLAEHCVMYPFDSVKTRMQSLCPCPETRCPTALHSLFSMVKREGFLRPLKGVNAIVLGSVPAHALYYTVYEKLVFFFINL